MRLFRSQLSGVLTKLLCAGIVSGCSSKSPPEQLADINAEYERVRNRYQETYDSAETPEEADRAFSELFPNTEYFTKKYFQLALDYPDSAVTAEALKWVAVKGSAEHSDKAMDVLFSAYAESDQMEMVALDLRHDISETLSEQRLRTLVKSHHRNVRAAAMFSLGEYLQAILEIHPKLADVERGKTFSKFYSAATIEYWRNHDVTADAVESLFGQVAAEYADIRSEVRPSYAERAEASLFAMRSLQPGQMAPEIEGPDLDGVSFRLSDYRGKVVLLSFWGHW